MYQCGSHVQFSSCEEAVVYIRSYVLKIKNQWMCMPALCSKPVITTSYVCMLQQFSSVLVSKIYLRAHWAEVLFESHCKVI